MLFRGVYLATRKRRIGFVTLLANWCFALGSLSPCECLSSSTRPLIMGCSALLSVVSQLLSVCNPADSFVRLQRGATPVAACLQAPAELCKAVAAASQAFGNSVRLSGPPESLSSSLEALCSLRLMQLREQIALHVFHHARLAKSPPYCPWLKRFHTLPVRLHAAIRACLRCLLPAGTALHSQFFSVNVITPSPSCRLRSISARRAKGTPKE